ncbi:hypothetical protein [Nonomuraea sp. NPDC023979]|uniref:hypothetical protein n=1 Tax=Nonomuraea sp. NPDC023979 TaxID=3154796 RepID=UPI0033DF5613
MARIRTIKPEFFTSLAITSLDLAARLTFIGLWTHCDDEGRCVDEARLIKAALWPLDDRTAADIEADLVALHRAALIIRYTVEGRRYLAVRAWKEHQRVNRPTRSKFPRPPDAPIEPHGGLSEDSWRTQTPLAEVVREPSNEGEMSEFRGEGRTRLVSVPSGQDEPSAPPVTSLNGARESSVNPHGALTEDSREERKGTGNREVPPSAGAAAPDSATAPVTPANAGDIVGAWIEGAKAGSGERPAKRLIAQVGRQARELIEEGKDPQRLIDAAAAAGRKGFADLGRELLRMNTSPDTGGGRFAPGSGSRAPLPTAEEIANGQVIL